MGALLKAEIGTAFALNLNSSCDAIDAYMQEAFVCHVCHLLSNEQVRHNRMWVLGFVAAALSADSMARDALVRRLPLESMEQRRAEDALVTFLESADPQREHRVSTIGSVPGRGVDWAESYLRAYPMEVPHEYVFKKSVRRPDDEMLG